MAEIVLPMTAAIDTRSFRCLVEEECCSAIDAFQDGNEGICVPEDVHASVYAARLSRTPSRMDRETDIPVMTPEGPSREGSRCNSRASSPACRKRETLVRDCLTLTPVATTALAP